MSALQAFNHTEKPIFLMCPPDHFAIAEPDPVHGAANRFEIEGWRNWTKDPNGFRTRAAEQWQALAETFNALGCITCLLPPQDGLMDQVFTADPSFTLTVPGESHARMVTILSTFSNTPRQAETAAHFKALRSMPALSAFKAETQMPHLMVQDTAHTFEGSGDTLYDPVRDQLFAGYANETGRQAASGGRTSIKSHDLLSQNMGMQTVSLNVTGGFFHIDTSLGFLSKGHIMCWPGGMTAGSFLRLKHAALDAFNMPLDEYLIEVKAEDAFRLVCNAVPLGDKVVMNECSENLKDTLKRKGYDPVTVDLSCFVQAGGAAHCLINHVNKTRTPGGVLQPV